MYKLKTNKKHIFAIFITLFFYIYKNFYSFFVLFLFPLFEAVSIFIFKILIYFLFMYVYFCCCCYLPLLFSLLIFININLDRIQYFEKDFFDFVLIWIFRYFVSPVNSYTIIFVFLFVFLVQKFIDFLLWFAGVVAL